MKINSVLFRHFRNGEFLQFVKNFLSIIRSFDLDKLLLSGKEQVFSEKVDAFDQVFKSIAGEELTAELKTLDTRRDKAIMGIKSMLNAYQYREEQEVVEAAGMLLEKYESYDARIDKLPYQQQTAVTNAYINDVKASTTLVSAMETTNITSWFELLEELNNTFDKTFIDRAKTIEPEANIQEKRKHIRKLYNELTEDIEAYARIATNKEEYFPMVESVNGLIEDYNLAIINRLKNRKEGEDIAPEQQN